MKDSYNKKSNNKYTDKELFLKLEIKTRELGRVPTKIEIDEDKTMPSSSTYFDRFGGISNAMEIMTENTEKDPILDALKDCVKEFYSKNYRSAGMSDVRKCGLNPEYITEKLGIKWNDFLASCNLPEYLPEKLTDKSKMAASYVIKKLKDMGVDVQDLRENNNSNTLILINDKIKVTIVTGSIKNTRGNKYWRFTVNRSQSSVLSDYYLCLGFEKFPNESIMFWIKTDETQGVQNIGVNINNIEKSKYGKYHIKKLEDIVKEGWIKNEI